ncbi:uromodulin-like [Cololabis saira]|uniref:uromodulin-like n=1 Tax=Cololabis saira TaxID=129043 RepID=UPI002AD4F649|nr:uromodulin-like [Cololabis saira]
MWSIMGEQKGIFLLILLQIFTGSSETYFVFDCGETKCRSSTDCIEIDGIFQCADPCEHYTALHDDWRSVNNTVVDATHSDMNIDWQGWYRLFLGQANAQLTQSCTGENRCGVSSPMWVNSRHGNVLGRIVGRQTCTVQGGNCCHSLGTSTLLIKYCYEHYYVYRLVKPTSPGSAYCAELQKSDPGVSTTSSPSLVSTSSTTTAGSSTVQQPPLQFSQLICGRDKVQVGVDQASMASSGLDPFSGNLAAINCSWVKSSGGVVWYEAETRAGSCGNILKTNSTHVVYSNSLFIYPENNASFALPVSLPFSCVYPLDTDSSLEVVIRPSQEWESGISGSGSKARANMSLFQNSNYAETYPAGQVILPVGSPLYVGVSVEETDSSLVVVLEDCFASHSSNPEDPNSYPLIQNKCPTNHREVSLIESGSSLRARFSALLFLLQGENRDIYLHCNLSLCDQRTHNCVPVCRRRMSRSVPSSAPVKMVTAGPITYERQVN